jgi:hypothetical protein
MPSVQTDYPETTGDAYNGMIATTSVTAIDTYVMEGETAVGWGVAVQLGSGANKCKAGMAANKFVGITVKDGTRKPEDNDTYTKSAHASLIYRGDIWVEVEGAVVVGGDVVAATATGKLSSAAADATHIKIDGARWMTAAANGKLARLRLASELPAS